MDVIAEADHIVDLGPEAGANGGEVVAVGSPEEVALSRRSRTAPFLREILKRNPHPYSTKLLTERADGDFASACFARAGTTLEIGRGERREAPRRLAYSRAHLQAHVDNPSMGR